jgi:hypothetical protein
MAICGCGLPALCCQPAVAGGFIYADLRSELNTHPALQALFTQSPVCEPLLQAFLFPSTLREVTLHPLSLACIFIYSSHGKWVIPPFPWSFPPTATFTSFPILITGRSCCSCQPLCLFTAHEEVGFPPSPVEFSSLCHSHKLPRSWFLGACPCSHQSLSGQARLVYLQFREGFPSPPLRRSGRPTLFATCVYCSYCLLLSFSYFPGGRFVCPGGHAVLAQGCLWEYTYHLAHLVHVFLLYLGVGDWRPRGPPGFSV